MSHEPQPSPEPPIASTNRSNSSAECLDSDAWLEDLLLAGVHAAVKPSLSTDPVAAQPTVEPPLPSWANADRTSFEIESQPEKILQSTKIDLDEANTVEEPSEQVFDVPNLDVEMNHLLSNEIIDTKPAEELDQLVDSIFHGLNAQMPAASNDEDEVPGEPVDEVAIEDDLDDVTAVDLPEPVVSDVAPLEIDPVAAEIAEAMKLVEAEIPDDAASEAEPAASIRRDEEVSTAAGPLDDEESTAKISESSDAMTQEAIHSLLAKFDDSDVPLPPPSAPKEPGIKASCPAGSPQPKINLAALKKVKPGGDDPPALAARLFGGDTLEGGGNDDASDRLSDDIDSSLTPLVMGEKQLPAFLLALDGVTDRLRKLHYFLPIAVGGLGAFLFVNGVITIVLASLGWI